jgi:putative spermidine/putrescine transport system permease protein
MTRCLGLLAVVVFLYVLAPVVVIAVSALGQTAYLAFPPHGLTLRWFAVALADTKYAAAFATSTMIAAAATVLSLAIGIPAAYGLARHHFPGRRVIETAILMPLVLPALVLSIALTILFSRIGFTAGSPRLVLAHLVLCVPYVVRVTLPVLQRLDPALEEAARNLGASPAATFLLVTLPAIRPGVIAAATLAFIVSFDEIDLAIFLADPRAPTLPVTIYSAIQLGIDPTVGAVSALLVLLAAAGMGVYAMVLWRAGSPRAARP